MLPALNTRWALFPLILCILVFAVSGICSQQTPTQRSTQSKSMFDPNIYLPPGPGQSDASILAYLLYSLNEPSLLEVAKDKSVLSFRVSFFASEPGQQLAIRLAVNADGTGEITSVVSLGPLDLKHVKRTKNVVSAADVRKFLQFIDDVGFWSMTTINKTEQTDSAGHRIYTLDGSWCMVEGVREGSFHYVYRRNPTQPSPFTRIGHYLARDLANLDGIALTSSPPFSQ